MNSNYDYQRPCPYVGLQPFEEANAEFFFGRKQDQNIIISNLLASTLTILYGSSGVGKSSILMAGVIPQLRVEQPKTPVVVFREWVDDGFQLVLARACISAVWKEGIDQPKPVETLPLDDILKACVEAAHAPILLIFDQFEEFFLYHPKSSDPNSFEVQFARMVNREDVDVGVLIALREDSLAKLDRFQERIPNLLSNCLRLKHLDQNGAEDAIRKPLEVWNAKYAADKTPVNIENELVVELIQQVRLGQVSSDLHGGIGTAHSGDENIEAPFLQLVLFRIWDEEMRTGSNRLRRDTLDRLKGAKEIVRSHLNDVMTSLEAADQSVCARFFDRLVTPTGSKVACSGEDLAHWAGDLAPRVPDVLKLLSRDRILRTVAVPDNPEATRYEIFHDVLAPAILDWRRRYGEEQERVFALEQAAKRVRTFLKRMVVLVAITLFPIIVAHYWWKNLCAIANQKAAESNNIISANPQRSLALAMEAVQTTAPLGLSPSSAAILGLSPTPAAEDALRQAIQASPLEWTLDFDYHVNDIAFNSDGSKLATAGDDKKVEIWNIAIGFPPKLTPIAFSHSADKVFGVAFLTSDDRLVSVADEKAYLWSFDDPKAPLRFYNQGSPIYSAFAVSRDGKRLATAGKGDEKGNGKVIKVWDLDVQDAEPKPITTIDVKGAWVMGLAFSPDGCCLATACVQTGGAERTSTSIWNIKTKSEILQVPNKLASDAVAFTPDGKSLVTASRDDRIRVWRQPACNELDSFLNERSESVTASDTDTPSKSADIIWNERILSGHSERVKNIAISPDGTRIASAGGSGDAMVKIWDTESGENLLTLTGHKNSVEAVKFSPDGHYVASASRDKTVKLWNIERHTNTVNSIAFSPDGKMLATGSSDRTAKLWDISGDKPHLLHTLTGHTDQIYRLAFNPAGTLLATASFDNSVKLWDTSSGNDITAPELKKHGDQLRGVAFSPDGKWLASVGADGKAWFNNLENAAQTISIKHNKEDDTIHSTQVSTVDFHPFQDRWATGGYDGKLQLWDVYRKNIGEITLPADAPSRSVTDIAFSPDGSVITAIAGHSVYMWPVSTFEHPQSVPITILIKETDYCRSFAYSHDGKQLAVACNDAKVRIYDTAKHEQVKSIKVHKAAVSDLAFSSDDTKLASASNDRTFQVSPLRFEELYELAKRLQADTSGENP